MFILMDVPMRYLLPIGFLLMAGCINISNQITPTNPAVKPMTEGSDCSYVLFGFGYGDNTVEAAMRNAQPPVTSIRSITLDHFALFMFGSQCLTVVGESSPLEK